MNKYLVLFVIWLFLPNYVSAQKPSGPRPPQDTLKYVGMFAITPDETEEDYNTYIFSPIDNRAAYIGSLSDFMSCLNDSMSKKTKKYFEQNQEWVILSFVVEKDSTVSNVQVWLSDDPIFSEVQQIWSLYDKIEGYPGWGKVFIAGSYYQIWRSRNKGVNKDLTKFITQTRWEPIRIHGKIVRSKRYFHMPINLISSE